MGLGQNLRLTLALAGGRCAAFASRRLGTGGTILPGRVIDRIDPSALSRLAEKLHHGSMVISGTNGKTTTARMVARALAASGRTPVHNRSGANLPAGITSAIAARSDLSGRVAGDVGIFEVDEAHVPAALLALSPRVVVLTNVFRDQLDRYGEVDFIADIWQKAVAGLDPSTTLVVNADDPIVSRVAEAAPGPVVTFGVDDPALGSRTLPHDADRRLCPRCAALIEYTCSFYGHLGHYGCAACGWGRNPPTVSLRSAVGDSPQQLSIRARNEEISISLRLTGLYNTYNALAATAASLAVGVTASQLAEAFAGFIAVFGRQERIPVGRGELTLTLVKNPVGFNQALATEVSLSSRSDGQKTLPRPIDDREVMVIAINDRFADGRDISWLWDVDFEMLSRGHKAPPLPSDGTGPGGPRHVLCTGSRAQDLAVRLKYALLPVEAIEVAQGEAAALDVAVGAARNGSHVAVFASYTAMLEIRRLLQDLHYVQPFWDD